MYFVSIHHVCHITCKCSQIISSKQTWIDSESKSISWPFQHTKVMKHPIQSYLPQHNICIFHLNAKCSIHSTPSLQCALKDAINLHWIILGADWFLSLQNCHLWRRQNNGEQKMALSGPMLAGGWLKACPRCPLFILASPPMGIVTVCIVTCGRLESDWCALQQPPWGQYACKSTMHQFWGINW